MDKVSWTGFTPRFVLDLPKHLSSLVSCEKVRYFLGSHSYRVWSLKSDGLFYIESIFMFSNLKINIFL